MIHYDKQNKTLLKLRKERDLAVEAARRADAERKRLYTILDGIMHETRRLNLEIASACEDVSKSISNKNYSRAESFSESAFYTSGLISSRLTFADYELNPESVVHQTKYSTGIYKKFDKASRILSRSAKLKRVNIRMQGSSRNEIDVLPAFEMVPFVILDNAVKYSPDDQEITICVADNPLPGVRIEAAVTSIGPRLAANELSEVLKRGVRGSEAARTKAHGDGIGLYLANQLTQLANGRMTLASSADELFSLEGVGYSTFTATLTFR